MLSLKMSTESNVVRYSKFDTFESPLSNLWFSNFKLDGKKYNSVEQFFQFQKAEFFDDKVTAGKVMDGDINPWECRRLGDAVDMTNATPTVNKIWPEYAKELIRKACLAKFSQNDWMRKYLFKSTGNPLVYCDLFDRFWGNGLRKYDLLNKAGPTGWPGMNHLGQILDSVWETMMKDPAHQELAKKVTRDKHKNKRKLESYHKRKLESYHKKKAVPAENMKKIKITP